MRGGEREGRGDEGEGRRERGRVEEMLGGFVCDYTCTRSLVH